MLVANGKRSISKQTRQQISGISKTVRQQNRSIRRTANSKITHQQTAAKFSDQVKARAVFRPETSGPELFTA
jgi:hypothetical protein